MILQGSLKVKIKLHFSSQINWLDLHQIWQDFSNICQETCQKGIDYSSFSYDSSKIWLELDRVIFYLGLVKFY